MTMRRIVSALLLLAASSSVTADYTSGLEAYERGDYETALREFRLLAGQGDTDAQNMLGIMYDKGLGGISEDDEQAVEWYRKAAEQGNPAAQYNLGFMYQEGRGVDPDYREAWFWYRRSAEQGTMPAQNNLGILYSNGRGVDQDHQEAWFWYRRSAEQGNPPAQHNLGIMYDTGEGIPEDDEKAVEWYRKAAEGGHPPAQYNLGVMYDEGLRNIPEDDEQAVEWYRKAAEQGNPAAQRNLGVMYATGEGTPKDDVEAYAWLNLAAAQGLEEAEQSRTDIQQRMTSIQIAEAQQRSRELATSIADGRGERAAPATAPSDLILPSDPSRSTVRAVQVYLTLVGYDPGPVDGLLGRRTTAAVQQFQKDAGITPTGRISDELLLLMQIAMDATRPKEQAKPVGNGSGFLVRRKDGKGKFVTNHHVVRGCARVTVGFAGMPEQHHPATVLAVNEGDDLALLEAPPGTGEAATFSESPRASLGEVVMVAGYPLYEDLSRELQVTRGNVSALAGVGDDAKRLQITAPVQMGNSGGPLLDGAGNVIGVVVSKLDAVYFTELTGDIPQNVNFAIKGALVRGFLDIHGVKYHRRPSDKKLAPERLAEMARGFTVAVHCWE